MGPRVLGGETPHLGPERRLPNRIPDEIRQCWCSVDDYSFAASLAHRHEYRVLNTYWWEVATEDIS